MNCNHRPARLLALGTIIAGALWAPDANAQLMRMLRGAACEAPIGSVRISEPDDGTELWSSYGLSAPTRMLRVMVAESRCFTVVDRGAGYAAIREEQELAAAGQLREGQNMGAGQMRAADFVLIPDIVSQNANAGGTDIGVSGAYEGPAGPEPEAPRRGGLMRGLVSAGTNLASGGLAGSITGGGRAGLSTRRQNAEVVLTLVDARTSEQVASVSGEAEISDKAWDAAMQARSRAQGVRGGISVGSWENTEIGKVIKEAYEHAYQKMEPALRRLAAQRAAEAAAPVASAAIVAAPMLAAPEPPPAVAPVHLAMAAEPAPAVVAPVVPVAIETEAAAEAGGEGIAAEAEAAVEHGASADAGQTLVLRRTARLLALPSSDAAVVADLRTGMLLFPTGTRDGVMLEVEDEMGQRGWVPSAAVSLAP